MLKVGITGGIGSGKTTACKLFELLGVQVYYADNRAKHLVQNDDKVRQQIEHTFGSQFYIDGKLDRKAIAAEVFKNAERLEKLNAIVHPAVNRDFYEWLKKVHKAPYILKEAALLFETGSAAQLDYLITVSSPEDLRISRVMSRDNVIREAVLARMNNQMPAEKKEQLSDFILTNDDKHLLIPQVIELDEILRDKENHC